MLRSRSSALWLVLLWMLVVPAASMAQAKPGPRIALLIANSDYRLPSDKLAGPQHDANLVARALAGQGFAGLETEQSPTILRNLSREEMWQALRRFKASLANAGPNAMGFFYYAGHGSSDATGSDNFMLPVDTADIGAWAPGGRDEAMRSAVSVRGVTELVSDVADTDELRPAIVIVVDACRTSPGSTPGIRGGGAFTRMVMPDNALPPGVLVALSTRIGQAAPDAGHYAKVLAKQISVNGGKSVATVFDDVKTEVFQSTGRSQLPVSQSQITRRVCFAACTEVREAEMDPEEARIVLRNLRGQAESAYDRFRRADGVLSCPKLASELGVALDQSKRAEDEGRFKAAYQWLGLVASQAGTAGSRLGVVAQRARQDLDRFAAAKADSERDLAFYDRDARTHEAQLTELRQSAQEARANRKRDAQSRLDEAQKELDGSSASVEQQRARIAEGAARPARDSDDATTKRIGLDQLRESHELAQVNYRRALSAVDAAKRALVEAETENGIDRSKKRYVDAAQSRVQRTIAARSLLSSAIDEASHLAQSGKPGLAAELLTQARGEASSLEQGSPVRRRTLSVQSATVPICE